MVGQIKKDLAILKSKYKEAIGLEERWKILNEMEALLDQWEAIQMVTHGNS